MKNANEGRADQIMTTPIISVAETMPLRDAAALLTDEGISGALVIDHAKRPLGAVSLTDIAHHLAGLEPPDRSERPRRGAAEAAANSPGWEEGGGDPDGPAPEEATVADVMTSGLVSVPPDATLRQVARTMADHGIQRVFVADARGPIGLVTTMDLIQGLAGKRTPRAALAKAGKRRS
jgi:CBS domain-containing protein